MTVNFKVGGDAISNDDGLDRMAVRNHAAVRPGKGGEVGGGLGVKPGGGSAVQSGDGGTTGLRNKAARFPALSL